MAAKLTYDEAIWIVWEMVDKEFFPSPKTWKKLGADTCDEIQQDIFDAVFGVLMKA